MTPLKLAVPRDPQGAGLEYRLWLNDAAPSLTKAKLDWWRATSRGSTVDFVLPPLAVLDPLVAAAHQQVPMWTEAVLAAARAWASDRLGVHKVTGFFERAEREERIFTVLIEVPRSALATSQTLDAEEELRDVIFSSFAEPVGVRIRRVDGV